MFECPWAPQQLDKYLMTSNPNAQNIYQNWFELWHNLVLCKQIFLGSVYLQNQRFLFWVLPNHCSRACHWSHNFMTRHFRVKTSLLFWVHLDSQPQADVCSNPVICSFSHSADINPAPPMCQYLLCANVWVMAENKPEILFPVDLILVEGIDIKQ